MLGQQLVDHLRIDRHNVDSFYTILLHHRGYRSARMEAPMSGPQGSFTIENSRPPPFKTERRQRINWCFTRRRFWLIFFKWFVWPRFAPYSSPSIPKVCLVNTPLTRPRAFTA
jgi:hypothetical protein